MTHQPDKDKTTIPPKGTEDSTSPSAYCNGHKILWNFEDGEWYYEDGQKTDICRKCPKCDKMPTKENHDACLSNLPGVKNACCGHGVEDGYIQFKDGTVIRFQLKEIERIK